MKGPRPEDDATPLAGEVSVNANDKYRHCSESTTERKTPRLLLSISEAAQALGVSVSQVERLIRDKEMPSVKLRRRRLIPTESLKAWVRSKTEGAAL